MRQIKTLVFMQLKDKIDVSWIYSTKSRINTVVLSLLKFVLVTAIYTVILYATSLLGLVMYSDMPYIMTFVLTLAILLSFITCSWGLMKTLYFSEDNKVLITMPIKTNKIFISKLLMFYFYEIKRSFTFTIPLILACAINLSLKASLHFSAYFWMIIPIIFVIALPVLLGAIFSVPLMYLYRLFNKYNVLKAILAISIIILFISGAIFLINLLPSNIDLISQWPDIRPQLVNFFNVFEEKNILIKQLVRILIGEKNAKGFFCPNGWTILKTLILIVISCALFFINYFISRPIFFKMMSKNFEFNKNNNMDKANVKHNKFITFDLKELRISFRSLDISINYLSIYIIIPILILLLNKIFVAINRQLLGYHMSYAFNILLILLPLLASNSLIATLYSKEGRAGYIKKTKPVKPLVPLMAKLTFNIILSLPCVIISVSIFGYYQEIGVINTIMCSLWPYFLLCNIRYY